MTVVEGARRRVALMGTGHRGASMWGLQLLESCGEHIEFVALCDANPIRLARVRETMGVEAPVYTDYAAMLREVRPETVIVCTRDRDHDAHIVAALEAGADVVTEKPMTTTLEKCRNILEAEARTGRRVDVTFNYRYAPTARRIKEMLMAGAIGTVVSVDFHWYLDVEHGADYFRRWHAYEENSGSLFVHKATHHFDLLNWYLDSDPSEVFARGSLNKYGHRNPFRGIRCKGCRYADTCDFHIDIGSDPWLDMLYEEPSKADGYVRDACVFREDIDIPDTMSAAIVYDNGVKVSYSLNTFMPVEGHHLAFNGTEGRIEIRQYERQPWDTPSGDEILHVRNFNGVERIHVPKEPGGHFGGDPKLHRMLFHPGTPDPLAQRAGSRAGAASVLCGVAAMESVRRNAPVSVKALIEEATGRRA